MSSVGHGQGTILKVKQRVIRSILLSCREKSQRTHELGYRKIPIHAAPPHNLVSRFSKSTTFGDFLPVPGSIKCPSSINLADCAITPPGNLSFRLPSSLTTRQYGVIRFFPFAPSSSAASETIRRWIPVVSGQVDSAPESFASRFLICPVVTSFPFGTFRINPST